MAAAPHWVRIAFHRIPLRRMSAMSRAEEIISNLNSVKSAIERAKLSVDANTSAVRRNTKLRTLVQELLDKAKELPGDIQWHFTGSLQSNKCKLLASIPNLFAIETVDGEKKADTLNKACSARDEPLQVFIQINTSSEETKNGIDPSDCLRVCEHVLNNCSKLRLFGLMTIGSPEHSEMDPNPDFVLLANCKSAVDEKLGTALELSMGMSDDFEAAVKLGSTNVRVGSSIFGSRYYG
ncbi:hypothetical protein HK098_003409 [Nowakowskiella sp. JEL0407]|nr:hypothetical protein HK098_003409 [Nowakowskiella sp. JEL0407]